MVDLGAEYTQISPVLEGYTSTLSSSFYRVTGNRVDDYIHTRLTINFAPKEVLNAKNLPKLDLLQMYKMKTDLKETRFSPYKIPFNYEMLQEMKNFNNKDPDSYKRY